MCDERAEIALKMGLGGLAEGAPLVGPGVYTALSSFGQCQDFFDTQRKVARKAADVHSLEAACNALLGLGDTMKNARDR